MYPYGGKGGLMGAALPYGGWVLRRYVIPALRPGGKKLFHRGGGRHRSGALSTDLQLLVAGAILGLLLASPRPTSATSS